VSGRPRLAVGDVRGRLSQAGKGSRGRWRAGEAEPGGQGLPWSAASGGGRAGPGNGSVRGRLSPGQQPAVSGGRSGSATTCGLRCVALAMACGGWRRRQLAMAPSEGRRQCVAEEGGGVW
jgi:hypothetical protein